MKRKTVVVLAAVLFFAMASQSLALVLSGTIRDFTPSTNADFEGTITGLVSGLVLSTLGTDGNPVYAHGSTSYGSIQNAASFSRWYDGGINGYDQTNYDLTLTETSPGTGIYAYENTAFFPIDGRLLGNYEDTGRNYHFTYEIHSTFTYKAGQVFSFSGDDDVWVFIDKKLALDLGGIHSAVNGSIVLDTLGLSPGKDYAFDFFFAERHTTLSNLKIETSIPLKSTVPIPGAFALFAPGLGALFMARKKLQK